MSLLLLVTTAAAMSSVLPTTGSILAIFSDVATFTPPNVTLPGLSNFESKYPTKKLLNGGEVSQHLVSAVYPCR